MSRVAYVNGRYVPHRGAAVHVEDRGYQFADGVYEVVAVHDGRLVDEEPHLDRLARSLGELRMGWPLSPRALQVVMREVIRRNRVHDGIVYLQITRGVAPRDHKFPAHAQPALVVTARSARPADPSVLEDGVRVITIDDIRWARCDIKSVSLLPNCLGKQQAYEAGALEAWQVDADGRVTEGTSTNAWIITAEGTLVTRPATNEILDGITRRALMQLIEREGMAFEERAFTAAEAKRAREAFLTSTTNPVTPVSQVDDAVIGNGKPGSFTLKLHALYREFMAAAPPAARLPDLASAAQ